jgi:hypothetical protein
MHAISVGKAIDDIVLVLPDAPDKVAGNAYIKRASSTAGKNVGAR